MNLNRFGSTISDSGIVASEWGLVDLASTISLRFHLLIDLYKTYLFVSDFFYLITWYEPRQYSDRHPFSSDLR